MSARFIFIHNTANITLRFMCPPVQTRQRLLYFSLTVKYRASAHSKYRDNHENMG
ncbi:unnamed protein product, partial [Ixodes pacificus]